MYGYEIGEEVEVAVGVRKGDTGIVSGFNDRYILVNLDDGSRCSYDLSSIKKKYDTTPSKYSWIAKIEIETGSYYYALYDETILTGDFVAVTGKASGKILEIAEIISAEEVKERFAGIISEEVICKLHYNVSDYEARIKKRKRAAELREAMEKRIRELNEVQKYAVYADSDEQMRTLYDEFKRLETI